MDGNFTIIGGKDKIYLPYFDQGVVVELINPLLKNYSISIDHDFIDMDILGGTKRRCVGRESFSFDMSMTCYKANMIECHNMPDLFSSLTESMSVSELLNAVEEKIKKRG